MSDDWVYVWEHESIFLYYQPSSVLIDNQNKTIQLWVKDVYTEIGKIDFLQHMGSIDREKYHNIKHRLDYIFIDYNQKKSGITHTTYYSSPDNVLFDYEYTLEWKEIPSGCIISLLLQKLMRDYNIKR